jgi:hypothetical protein
MDDRIQAEKPARPKDPVALSLARNEPNPFTLQAETCSWSIVWFFVVPALLLSPCLMSAAIGAAQERQLGLCLLGSSSSRSMD